MKYYTIQRQDGELVTICGELVAVAEPINTAPAASPAPAAARPAPAPRTSARGRRVGCTGEHSTAGKRALDSLPRGTSWRDVIVTICARNGWHQIQLADKLNVSGGNLTSWKTGLWNPDRKHADALLRLYHASGARSLAATAKEVMKNATSQ